MKTTLGINPKSSGMAGGIFAKVPGEFFCNISSEYETQ